MKEVLICVLYHYHTYCILIICLLEHLIVYLQKMRENFPSAHLLTSRSINHIMFDSMNQGEDGEDATSSYHDPACQANIQRYLKNGYIDFVDGHVCEVRSRLRLMVFLDIDLNL